MYKEITQYCKGWGINIMHKKISKLLPGAQEQNYNLLFFQPVFDTYSRQNFACLWCQRYMNTIKEKEEIYENLQGNMRLNYLKVRKILATKNPVLFLTALGKWTNFSHLVEHILTFTLKVTCFYVEK